MGFQKVYPVGTLGQLEINESGGNATVKLSLSQSVGGGSVAGVAKAALSAEVDVSAAQLIDAGFALAAAKYPSAAALIAVAKAAVDAELAKA